MKTTQRRRLWGCFNKRRLDNCGMFTPLPFRRSLAVSLFGLIVVCAGSWRVSAADAPAAAPVPPAVAIARPSAEEIAIAASSLERFVAQADATTKTILAKYP